MGAARRGCVCLRGNPASRRKLLHPHVGSAWRHEPAGVLADSLFDMQLPAPAYLQFEGSASKRTAGFAGESARNDTKSLKPGASCAVCTPTTPTPPPISTLEATTASARTIPDAGPEVNKINFFSSFEPPPEGAHHARRASGVVMEEEAIASGRQGVPAHHAK